MTEILKITIAPPLDCGVCDEVLLELYNPLLIAEALSAPDPVSANPFIRGKIVDLTEIDANTVEYCIEYDETLLSDPGTPLVYGDVKTVCCVGCTLKYIDQYAICELIQASASDCLTGVYLFTVAATEGGAANPFTIVGADTFTFEGGRSLAATAGSPDAIVYDLELSADAGNLLVFGTDTNIFLDCPTVLSCINVVNPITGDGSTGTPFGIAISPDANNSLELRANGLFTSGIDDTLTCTEVRTCIYIDNPLQGNGTLAVPYTVALSSTPGNILVLNPDGLYVPDLDCADILACINVVNPISGDGSGGTPFGIDISAVGGNILVLQPDGLYVPALGGETVTTIVDSGFAPSGAPQATYTNEVGATYEFEKGIFALDLTDVCNGVGPNNMVKQVSLAGNPSTLTVRSAPEIEHDAAVSTWLDNTLYDLDVVGLQLTPIRGPYIFANPFSCRRAAIRVMTTNYANWFKDPGSADINFTYGYEKRINGGAWQLVIEELRVYTGSPAIRDTFTQFDGGLDMVNGPLAIGGNITVETRQIIDVSQAGPGGSDLGPQTGSVSVEFFSTL